MGFTKMLGLWKALVRQELKGEEKKKKVSVNNREIWLGKLCSGQTGILLSTQNLRRYRQI